MSNAMQRTLAELAQRMPRVVREHEVLRVAGWMPSEKPADVAKAAIEEILKWIQKRCGNELPPRASRHESFEHYSGGRNANGVRLKSGDSDIWAIRADEPDKTIAGRVWTHEVVVGLLPGQPAKLSARQLCSTPENELPIEPHAPGFVQQVTSVCTLIRDTVPLLAKPMAVTTDVEADELINHLINPKRVLPTFVVTLPIGSEVDHPHLDVGLLSRATLGLAHVAVVRPDMTWRLTQQFGKFRSVFGGAIRVYMPGFDEFADPYSHRLVLADQLSAPGGGQRCLRWLRVLAAAESIRHAKLGKDVLAFSDIRAENLRLRQAELESKGASDTDRLKAAQKRLAAQQQDIERNKAEQQYYVEEHEKELQRAEFAERQSQAAAHRIQELTRLLKAKGDDPDSEIALPVTWQELPDWCDNHLSGRLVLTPAARRGTKAAEFPNVEIAARCLMWLATECRDRRAQGGEGTLREAPILVGVRNSPCGSDTYDFDWNGRSMAADWHVKNGGNTRDPSRCLRIYYCFDEQTQQIIVSDLPSHRRTGAS